MGAAVCFIVNRNGWTRQPLTLCDVIPETFRPPPEPERTKTPEEQAEENRRGWRVLDSFFGKPR